MKRLLMFALCLVLVLPLLVGCETKPAHTLRVGYGRVDITPEESVPLRGYGNTSKRMSTEVSDPLYGTCVAFTDEKDNTVLLFHTDLIGAGGDTFLWARSDIAKATGVPMAQVMISGTHMHSGPDMTNTSIESIPRYNESLRKWLVEAAQAARADRKPAKLYTTEARPVGYNFIRHYVLEDGEVIGDNFGSKSGREYTGHVSEADNQMQLVKITREGVEDIVLVNWQGHPHRGGGSSNTKITADIVGSMRSYMEEKIGCKFAYFTGASGNVNQQSRIDSENAVSKELPDDYIIHGQQLGQIAIDALQNCTEKENGNVQLVASSPAIQRKNANEGTRNVELFAFSIGDIGFVCAPYEMFDNNGREIKTGSKFETTFVVTCANFGHSYIPSNSAYQYENSEEPYEVNSCKYIPGTGETLAQEFVKMLNGLYETRK